MGVVQALALPRQGLAVVGEPALQHGPFAGVDRKPRTTAIVRKAVGVARLNMMRSRPGIALRNATIATLSKAGPALFLRSFDGIADWRPPRPPYASDETRVGTP
jgi:hypothetical protein